MKNKSNLYQLTVCALMAALMCVLGPLSLPIGPIPVTLTNFVIYLAVYLLGAKGAFVSTLVYLLLGAVGMPVFSNMTGGLAKLVGPTGGYLIGDLFVALIGGFAADKSKRNPILTGLGLVVSTAVLYFFGTVWFLFLTGKGLAYALSACVTPFIPLDMGKIVLAVVFGKLVRTALQKANLLPEAM